MDRNRCSHESPRSHLIETDELERFYLQSRFAIEAA